MTSEWADRRPTGKAHGVSPEAAQQGPVAPSGTGRGAGGAMDRIMVAVAIGMGLVFGIGVLVGVIAMVSMAIRREAKLGTLTRQPPERTDQ